MTKIFQNLGGGGLRQRVKKLFELFLENRIFFIMFKIFLN